MNKYCKNKQMDTKFTKVWRTKLWDSTENVRLLFIFLDIGLALHWGNKVAEQVVCHS